MITKNSIDAARPLAEKLTQKGMLLRPYETSPLDQLIKAGHLPLPKVNADQLPETEERILIGSQSKDQAGVVRHDVVMEEITQVIAKTVRKNIDLARNVVNPIVKEVYEDAKAFIVEYEQLHSVPIRIKIKQFSDIWNTNELGEMVSRYNEQALENPYLDYGFGFDTKNIVELAYTGSPSFDEKIKKMASQTGEANLHQLFTLLFSPIVSDRASNLKEVIGDNADPNKALWAHLWTRNLLDHPTDEFVNRSGNGEDLGTYRAYMSLLVSISGTFVYRFLKSRDLNETRKQLIFSYPTGPLTNNLIKPLDIVVNGDVYKKWLEDGGEPEILFGAYLSDRERGYNTLLENKEQYAKIWNKELRLLNTTKRFNRFNYAVEGLEKAIEKQIRQLDDEHLIVDRGLLYDRLKEKLKTLKGTFYEELYLNSRRLVCQIMFPHTHAMAILSSIDQVGKEYPDIDPREAALLAVVEIMGHWLGQLCQVDYAKLPEKETADAI